MRVAIDCHMVGQPAPGDAGNARFHATVTRAMAATGTTSDEVIALFVHEAARPLLAPDDPADPGSIRLVPVPEGNLARLVRRVPAVLAEERPAAALFSYVAPARTAVPLVVVVHDASFHLFPEWFSRRDRVLLRTLVPRAMARAALVATVSETSRNDIVAAFGLDPERIAVIPNMPAPAFTPKERAAERMHERFGLVRYCLYVGDVHPRKNLPALAAALGRLGDPGLELLVVGRAGHRGRAIIAESGARWLGPQDDETLADLYRAAAVTAYPSLYEGFGLPVVEAMACGSPVVAARRGAIPEVAGEAAILVEPDADGIAEGIAAALEPGTADRLRAAGPARAAAYGPRRTGESAWAAFRRAAA